MRYLLGAEGYGLRQDSHIWPIIQDWLLTKHQCRPCTTRGRKDRCWLSRLYPHYVLLLVSYHVEAEEPQDDYRQTAF